jgi:hypothetical protein
MSEKNIRNILSNARKSYDASSGAGYKSIVHVDVEDPATFAQIKQKLEGQAPNLIVEDLNRSVFFSEFKESKYHEQYAAFRRGANHNYAAASDVLRYRLLEHDGGVYMDVDDSITADAAGMDLLASDRDLLLNAPVSNEQVDITNEFNTSTLGSQPGNPLLREISELGYARFMRDKSFFAEPRPFVARDEAGNAIGPNAEDDGKRVTSYMRKISYVGGPRLLNDALREYASGLYNFRTAVVAGESEFVILPMEYGKRLTQAFNHHLSLHSKWKVDIGSDHSWESSRR